MGGLTTQHNNDALIETLASAEADLTALAGSDRDALVAIGVALKQAAADAPADLPAVGSILELVLGGLQTIFKDRDAALSGLPAALAEALGMARRVLSEPDDCPDHKQLVKQADEAIQAAMAAPQPEDAPHPDPVRSSPKLPAKPSLDDVAALLVQLDASDLPGLRRVREALIDIAERSDTPSRAAELAARAAARVDDITSGSSADPAESLAEAGNLIEAAMNAMLEPEPDESPSEAAQSAADQTPESAREGVEFTALPDSADRDLLAEFVTESGENLESAEVALLALETDPEDTEAVNTVFRAFHTIKGTSAFLELQAISELAHRAESLLSRVRDKEIRLTGAYADLALRSVDILKELMQDVQDALGGEPTHKPDGFDELMLHLTDPEAHDIGDGLDDEDPSALRLGDILVTEGKADREQVELAAAEQDDRLIGETIVSTGAASVTDVAKALRAQRGGESRGGQQSCVRVRTDRLDRLIETVGELVIAHSMVSQDEVLANGRDHDLVKKVSRTSKIVRELQDISMSMRMAPLRGTFRKMTRLVRDLARKSGKLVEFIAEGEDTEIDRNMVDLINDPLVHMVRNAVDHGIETPDTRERNGKPRAGTVRLSACHVGGNLVVEVQDDGKGLDRSKIAGKAVARGLIESDKGMSDSEVFKLILEPGFSTAQEVTEFSGRGVGLDVVRRNVEALRGRTDIVSERGRGCTFLLRLPLTLAVTDGMLVRVGPERYIVPICSIDITFRPDADALFTVAGRRTDR